MDPLEKLWAEILSREERRIIKAFQQLDVRSQKNILNHLKKMVEEEGWQPEQQGSARTALDVLVTR